MKECRKKDIRVIHVGQTGALLSSRRAGRTFFPQREWKRLPDWLIQPSERGRVRLCCSGHRLRWALAIEDTDECYECDTPVAENDRVLFCHKCWEGEDTAFVICEACNRRPRLPSLGSDALFHGPRLPAALLPPSFQLRGSGTVVIVPGGNYEFLASHEAWPVAQWLAGAGIAALVLRYRLLPEFGLEEALDDLESAVGVARQLRPGPVAALGFSAGGHLIAALAARAAAMGRPQPLDANVLVYPSLDPRGWADPETAAFTRGASGAIVDEECVMPKRAASLQAWTDNLLGKAAFGAPPTFMVASTTDTVAPPAEHTGPYRRLLAREKVPHVYNHRDLGEHGFALNGGWTDRCIKWLNKQGLGNTASKKRQRESPAT